MMRHVGWIRILGLLCAGLCAAPMTGAQNPPNRKSGANAGTVYRQPSQAAQRPAPAASTPRTAQTNIQKQPPAKTVQPQPAAGGLKPSTNVYTQPVTNVRPSVSSTPAAGSSVPAQTSTPGMYTHVITSGQPNGSANTAPAQPVPAQGTSLYGNKPAQSLSPKVTPTQPYVPAQTTPVWRNTPAGTTGTSGTSDGPPAGQSSPPATTTTPPYNKYNPKTSDGNNSKTSDGNNSKTSDGNSSKTSDGNNSKTSDGSPNGSPTKGGNSSTSDGNSNGSRGTGTKPPPAPTPTETHNRPPRVPPPQRPHAPGPQWSLPPVQIYPSAAIPSGQVVPPRGYQPSTPSRVISQAPPSEPSPVPSSPAPNAPSPPSPAQPSGNEQQPNTPTVNTPTPTPATPATPRPGLVNTGGERGTVIVTPVGQAVSIPPLAALTLTTKTPRPVVGKDVVVTAALEPSHAGATYLLNWGDGSPVQTVNASGEATHRYAKAKPYTVSASAVVDARELNHEVLVKVGPVGPRIDWLLAALAGMAALFLHFPPVPKLTASCRWGAPGVPEMKLLSREPYLSLSFEPGVGPAEEDITFAKKRRKSGLEQG